MKKKHLHETKLLKLPTTTYILYCHSFVRSSLSQHTLLIAMSPLSPSTAKLGHKLSIRELKSVYLLFQLCIHIRRLINVRVTYVAMLVQLLLIQLLSMRVAKR